MFFAGKADQDHDNPDGMALLTSFLKTRCSTCVIPNPRGFGGVRDLLFRFRAP
jgi:hypothetical protein